MANSAELIQAQELRFMQSWMHRDAGAIRRLAARDCMLVFGTNPPELLDRPSFLAAIESDFRCLGFRMGESVVRRHGRTAWFTASVDLELKIGAREWNARFLMTGLWRKHRIGGWKLVERSFAPLDKDERLAESVRRLQMWHG
ncbi:MAG: nuclear transport factor 2 family protein [Pseudomonadota bacterium]